MKLRKVKPGHRVLLGVMTWLFITDFVFAQEGVQRLRGLRARQPGLQEAVEAVSPPPVARAPRQPAEPVVEPADDVIADLDADAEEMVRLIYVQATLDIVLADYSEHTGRTLLLAPGVATQPITLQSEGELPLSKWLEAVETILNMYGVALLEEGDLFTRVVPNKTARNEPMEILAYEDDLVVEDSGELISQMIPLKHIESSEAVAAIKNLHHPYATVTTFEGINSILLTDTAASINRVLQILKYIDVPIEAREETFVIQILYAKASDIKSKLEQIIAEAQKDQKKSTIPRASPSGPPGVAAPRTPVGVIRARAARRATPTPEVLAEVERGLIRGDVKIIEDERTNLLIIITRPENIPFFEKIIKVLDVETQPDVMVRIFRLEYAEAKNVASMLNDLIGAAKSEVVATPAPDDERAPGGTALRDYVARRETAKPAAAAAPTGKATSTRKSKVGELSQENIKILSDERTNALIIMASRSDIAAMEEIIKDMDTMLLQVMIEVVILEINLDDSLRTGFDWIQRALITYEERSDGLRSAKAAYAGSGGGGDASPLDPLTLVSPTDFASLGAGAGLSYYLTLFDLNMDLVFRAVASDSRTRILSSPVIMTTDNKKATIEVTQDQYFFTGQRPIQSGGQIQFIEDVKREKIGIKLNVTPRINAKKFVVMEIQQSIENIAGVQVIGENEWPIVAARTMEAEIAVRSGETIILGGLVREQDSKSRSKVPILGDIPFLGFPFRGDSKREQQQEVIVLVTPYVMETPEDFMDDTYRRTQSMQTKGMWERGWSNSKLAEPAVIKPSGSALAPVDEGSPVAAVIQHEPPARTIRPRSRSRGVRRVRQPTPVPVQPMVAPLEVEPVEIEPVEVEPVEVEPVEIEPAPAVVDVPAPAQDEVEEEEDWDPLEALDPELRKYIKKEDKRWGRKIRKVDKKILKEYNLD